MMLQVRAKNDSMPNPGLRHALLLSAWLLGAVLPAHAQSAPQLPATAARPAAAQASAPPATGGLSAAFERADTDHDGQLSRQEAEHFPAMTQRFDEIDTNHDHFISRDEFIRDAMEF